jgi:cell division protein FtsA
MQIGQTTSRPLDRRVLCEIIESRMKEIATMVKQQLEKSGHFGTLTGGVIVTGGGSLLPATDRLFERVFEHAKARCAAPKVSGPGSKLASTPGFASAVGLARFALDSEDDELCIAGSNGKWTEKVRTLWSMLSGKA